MGSRPGALINSTRPLRRGPHPRGNHCAAMHRARRAEAGVMPASARASGDAAQRPGRIVMSLQLKKPSLPASRRCQ